MKPYTLSTKSIPIKLLSLVMAIVFTFTTVGTDIAWGMQIALKTPEQGPLWLAFQTNYAIVQAQRVSELLEGVEASGVTLDYVANKKAFVQESVEGLGFEVRKGEVFIKMMGGHVILRYYEPAKAPTSPKGYVKAETSRINRYLSRELLYSDKLNAELVKQKSTIKSLKPSIPIPEEVTAQPVMERAPPFGEGALSVLRRAFSFRRPAITSLGVFLSLLMPVTAPVIISGCGSTIHEITTPPNDEDLTMENVNLYPSTTYIMETSPEVPDAINVEPIMGETDTAYGIRISFNKPIDNYANIGYSYNPPLYAVDWGSSYNGLVFGLRGNPAVGPAGEEVKVIVTDAKGMRAKKELPGIKPDKITYYRMLPEELRKLGLDQIVSVTFQFNHYNGPGNELEVYSVATPPLIPQQDWPLYKGTVEITNGDFESLILSQDAYTINYAYDRGAGSVVISGRTISFTRTDGTRLTRAEVGMIVDVLKDMPGPNAVSFWKKDGWQSVRQYGSDYYWPHAPSTERLLNVVEVVIYRQYLESSSTRESASGAEERIQEVLKKGISSRQLLATLGVSLGLLMPVTAPVIISGCGSTVTQLKPIPTDTEKEFKDFIRKALLPGAAITYINIIPTYNPKVVAAVARVGDGYDAVDHLFIYSRPTSPAGTYTETFHGIYKNPETLDDVRFDDTGNAFMISKGSIYGSYANKQRVYVYKIGVSEPIWMASYIKKPIFEDTEGSPFAVTIYPNIAGIPGGTKVTFSATPEAVTITGQVDPFIPADVFNTLPRTVSNNNFVIEEREVPEAVTDSLYNVFTIEGRYIAQFEKHSAITSYGGWEIRSTNPPDASPDGKYLITGYYEEHYVTGRLPIQYIEVKSMDPAHVIPNIELRNPREDMATDVRFLPGSSTLIQVTYKSGDKDLINVDTGIAETRAQARKSSAGVAVTVFPEYKTNYARLFKTPDEKLSINDVIARESASGIVSAAKQSFENAKDVYEAYLAREEEALFLPKLIQDANPILTRVPIERLTGEDATEIIAYLERLGETPNIYVELYSMAKPEAILEKAAYEAFGLGKLYDKKFPLAMRAKENIVTLFAVSPDVEKRELQLQLQTSESLRHSIIIPIGLKDDAAGVVRGTFLGLRLIYIARHRDDEMFIRETIDSYRLLVESLGATPPHLTVDDIMMLLSNNITKIINTLLVIIRSLPIRAIDGAEIRAIRERAQQILKSA